MPPFRLPRAAAPAPVRELRGVVTSQLVRDQLAEERARKTSVESRASSLISSAATLTTLLFAVAKFAGSSQQAQGETRVAIIVALAFFVVSALLAIGAQRVHPYEEVSLRELDKRVSRNWWFAVDDGETSRRVSELGVNTIRAARRINDRKARCLRWAMGTQVGAIIAVATAVGLTLAGH